MAIIRITKEQIQEAHRARKAALKQDPEYRAYEEEQEKLREQAARLSDQEEDVL